MIFFQKIVFEWKEIQKISGKDITLLTTYTRNAIVSKAFYNTYLALRFVQLL